MSMSEITGARPVSQKQMIVDISQWGCLDLSSKGHQFAGCVNLNCSAQDAPDLTSVTSFNYMFFFVKRSLAISAAGTKQLVLI